MFAVQQTYLEKIPNAQGCLYLDQAQLDNFLTTVPTVIIPVGISNLGSHKSKKCGSYWSTLYNRARGHTTYCVAAGTIVTYDKPKWGRVL